MWVGFLLALKGFQVVVESYTLEASTVHNPDYKMLYA